MSYAWFPAWRYIVIAMCLYDASLCLVICSDIIITDEEVQEVWLVLVDALGGQAGSLRVLGQGVEVFVEAHPLAGRRGEIDLSCRFSLFLADVLPKNLAVPALRCLAVHPPRQAVYVGLAVVGDELGGQDLPSRPGGKGRGEDHVTEHTPVPVAQGSRAVVFSLHIYIGVQVFRVDGVEEFDRFPQRVALLLLYGRGGKAELMGDGVRKGLAPLVAPAEGHVAPQCLLGRPPFTREPQEHLLPIAQVGEDAAQLPVLFREIDQHLA